MATIEDNAGRVQRLHPTLPPRAAAGAGAPPSDPPKDPKVEARPDERTIKARPQTEQERQQAVLSAVKAAQAGQAADPAKAKDQEDDSPATQTVANAIGVADGVREGVRIGSSVDELRTLPVLGKVVQNEGRFGTFLTSLARSNFGQAAARALQNHRYIAPLARGLGRIAPFAGAVIAGFDIHGAVKAVNDPKASRLEKGLAITKGVFSTISGVAGMAALFLAPTGVGAAIAGGIALGAGILSTGADLWLGHVKNVRKKEEQQAKQPAAAK